MRHSPLPPVTSDGPVTSHVFTPWAYVAARRAAAGLTQTQLAAALSPRRWPHTYMAHVVALETPGLRLQTTVDLSGAMPISMDVYRQLADLPPHQHPRLCETCAWDERTAQPDRNGDETTWSRDNPAICSCCEQDAQAKAAA